MLDLHDASKVEIVGIVHLHHGLEIFGLDRLRFESQGSIGQHPIAIVVIFVDRAGINQMSEFLVASDVAVIRLQADLDVRMRKHSLEHAGLSCRRERLEFLAEIAIVAIGPDGNAPANGSIKFPRMAAPLLLRVVLEEQLVHAPADLGNDKILGIRDALHRHAPFFQRLHHLLAAGWPSNQLLECVQVHGKLPVAPLRPRKYTIFHVVPLGELAKIIDDPLTVRAEIVRTVPMKQHSCIIQRIICVSTDVIAAVHNEAPDPALTCESLREDSACEPRTDDQIIPFCLRAH